MDKNAIKKYAIWARNELIARVSQKAQQYGITAEGYGDKNADSVNGVLLSATERKQRQALIAKIDTEGFEQVMEEVAYTWFNRFIALRFMEVNNYLPSHTRVFTNEANEFKPQILADAISLEIEGLDMDKVFELKNANKDEELYKYLLIIQCNALSSILPGMFQRIADYTEILLPDYLLREGSVVDQMIKMIPENDWTDQVQIIGWLYQYYNSEKKDDVFAALKKNVKISKENIPAATQLFTPDWVVRYMVENSLGRLWIEGHSGEQLKTNWKYYIEDSEQNENIKIEHEKIKTEYAKLTPEDIKVIDPCMGSGHVLVYAFEVLMQIYESAGYTQKDAARCIVEKNIYGLDIDERAGQLAYFAVMMMARKYNRRILNDSICPNIMSIKDSNSISNEDINYISAGNEKIKKDLVTVRQMLFDAKEYGSILDVKIVDYEAILERISEIQHQSGQSDLFGINAIEYVAPIIKQAQIMSQKYDAVITNPPYMGASSMGGKLANYVKDKYPDSKADLFAVFIERCSQMLKKNAYQAMITQHSWMFLTSYERLRDKVFNADIVNMIHLGPRAFEEIAGEVVQTTAFVLCKRNINNKGTYCRLVEGSSQKKKEEMFLKSEERYTCEKTSFQLIPGKPVAYWISKKFLDIFSKGELLGAIADSKQGIATADNNRFLRLWYEVSSEKLYLNCESHDGAKKSDKKWFPYNKGGERRRWYGNSDYVVNWENDGAELRAFKKSVLRNPDFYFRECFSWSLICTGTASFRYKPSGFIFDVAGMSCFSNDKLQYLMAVCNSTVANEVLKVIAPTINYQCGDIANIPIIFNEEYYQEIDMLVKENIRMAKEDWDAFEVSWDFARHPLIGNGKIEDIYKIWEKQCNIRFEETKKNEERINQIILKIYDLEETFSYHVLDENITIRKADKQREVRSLISYAVGCMFGRYSVGATGIAFAGGSWNPSKFASDFVDEDNIIPICDDEYFEDDIVVKFIQFVDTVFGHNYLEENLSYIADALGGKGSSRSVIRDYFLNEFYDDHVRQYQKRPIYWLFDSGKKGGFKCLIYMHRYQPDTIARIRTDYVHEQQSRYRTALADLEQRINNASASDRVALNKRIKVIREQTEELRLYEERIHHLADQMIRINLDDGIKVNYEIFKDVLIKIK